MLKHTAVFAVAVILALGLLGLDAPNKPASMAGSWQVDTRHSDAKLITDARTRSCKLLRHDKTASRRLIPTFPVSTFVRQQHSNLLAAAFAA